MKIWLVILSLSAVGSMAWGQESVPLSSPTEESADAARVRIETQRLQQSQAFDQEDRVCLSRFAATACQNGVAKRRRTVLADLRRQELALNEVARNASGAAKAEHLRLKAAENAERLAERPATAPDQPRPYAPPVVASSTQASKPPRARDTQKKQAVEAVDPAVLAKARKAYASKQKALLLRRQERDKRLEKPAKPGLPVPP